MSRQFANDVATPSPISVSRDKYMNEIASDSPMHENTTPEMGSLNYSAKHYSGEFPGGYGVSVGSSSPSRENTTVNSQSTERGKES